jgi:hypothetical protein
MKNRLTFLALFAFSSACGGKDIYLSSTASPEADANGIDNAPDAASPVAADASVATCVQPGPAGTDAGPTDAGSSLAPLLGGWTGYVENYTFPSGSDALQLSFTAEADGAIAATIAFGQGPASLPAVDPTVGYWPVGMPTGAIPIPVFPTVEPTASNGLGKLVGEVAEGFAYTVEDVQFDGTRLRFGVNSLEEYKPWCALQTSYSYAPLNPCAYGCAPDWQVSVVGGVDAGFMASSLCALHNPDGGPDLTMNCGKVVLCDNPPQPQVCTCGSSGCTATPNVDTTFDMRLGAGGLDGSVAFASGGSDLVVHFTAAAGDP